VLGELGFFSESPVSLTEQTSFSLLLLLLLLSSLLLLLLLLLCEAWKTVLVPVSKKYEFLTLSD